MAWKTGYSYRMAIPVANSDTQEDKALDRIPFPAWFLASSAGGSKITDGTNYTDVHVTKADGTTELPCELNSDKNKLYVDYASMPVGRTVLYVYYGKSGDTAPASCYFYNSTREADGIVGARAYESESGSLVDEGFESGTDGSTLDATWTSSGTPQVKEYDSAQAIVGSLSGKLTGPTTAAYAGVSETTTSGITADNSEIRFWVYVDTTNQYRVFDDAGSAATIRCYSFQWSNNGDFNIYTSRTATGYNTGAYTKVGTYSTGWTQYKIVHNFTNGTYQLSSRTSRFGSWTQMKATGASVYDIPFRGTSTITQTNGMIFRPYQNANMWLDDVRYSTTAITDNLQAVVSTSGLNIMDANHEESSEGDTSPTYYVWGENLESTHISKGASDGYFGKETAHKIGYQYGDQDRYKILQGFEGGADAQKIDSIFYPYGSSTLEYETGTAAVGSASMRIATTAVTSGFTEYRTKGISTNSSEITFWARFNGTNKERYFQDYNFDTTSVYRMRFGTSGRISVYTDRTKTGYTTGAYTELDTSNYASMTWKQYRIVFNFTNSTYQFSYRASSGDAWTQLKAIGAADYDIPMTGSGTITSTSGSVFTSESATDEWWLDDIELINGGWTASTYANEYNYLIKYFEGALPKGTVSTADLHLYMTPTISSGGSTDLRCYRLKQTGDANADAFYGAIVNGWSNQEHYEYPTWNRRLQDPRVNTQVTWKNAGAAGTDEIDSTEYLTVSLTDSTAAGYQHFAVDTWMNDWIDPDAHSLGMVIKYNGGSGNNRYVTVAAPSQVNSPVLVVNFSSLDAEQLTARRISSDTYTTYATFTWQSRNSVSEDSNAYMAQLWCNGDLRSSIALVDPLTNRIYRTAKSIYPSTGRWGSNSPTWGLQYDQTTHRYWISGNDANGKIVLGYTPAYQLNSWTTVTNTNIATGKSAMTVVNDVCYCFALNGITEPTESDPYVNDLDYFTYTRTSNTWSSPTTVVSQTVATKRNIVNAIGAGDTLDGTTNILCDGSLDSYPSFGFFTVDSEFFWYQSKSGSTFNNVTRATFGSTAAAHSAGAQAKHLVGIPTYTSIEHDPQNNCLHVTWSYNKVRGGSSAYEYMGLGYLRHYYADSATTWKKSDDTSETLPYIPANIQLISDNTGLCYPNTLLCSPTGDVVQMYTKTNSFTSSSYNKIMLSYLHSGQTSFTKVDPGFATSNIIPAATSLGNDNMSLTCIYTGTQRKSMSENAGETWSALQDVSTHSFNVRSTLTGSGMSNGSSVDGYSLSYYQGAGTSSGSVWINAIEMTPAAPSTLDATVNGSQVDLTWADNSTTETGFYISRSVDGGAFTDNYDTAAADAETYSDTTLPGGWETLTYRVASYNTIGTSPWSNEVTIYSAIPIDGNGLTSDTSQDSLTVVQTHALSGTGFDSDTSIDTTTISQTHIFSSNGLTSDANNDTLSISQTHIITLNGLTSDTATDNLSLASSVKLNPEQHFIYDEEFAIRLGVSKVSTWTERPEGTEGMFGFNDTTGRFEIFHNNAWDLMERWDDLRFPAQAVNPVGAASDPTWDVDNIGWGFSASATNMVQIVAQIPHAWKIGSELRPHIHWQPTSTNTGNVLWRMEYKWTNANDTESGTWTTIDVLDAGDGTIGKHQIASFAAIDGTGKGLSSILSIKLSRIGGDGTDTYTGVALMKEFDIHYVVDGDGSRQEYIK